MDKIEFTSILRPKEPNQIQAHLLSSKIVAIGGIPNFKLPILPNRLTSSTSNQSNADTQGIEPEQGGSSRGLLIMAKRNARERNRVKQVNQGFLTLRHYIPDRYCRKKMSKVDTLRSAVEYIRSLEDILKNNETIGQHLCHHLPSSDEIDYYSPPFMSEGDENLKVDIDQIGGEEEEPI